MKTESGIEEKFSLFVFTIIELENELIRLHSLSSSPYNAPVRLLPRQGSFSFKNKVVEYKFHGGGCCFIVDGISYDYNILSPEFHSILISPWKFSVYLNGYGESTFNEAEVVHYFEIMEKGGLLTRLPEGSNIFKVNIDKVPNPY